MMRILAVFAFLLVLPIMADATAENIPHGQSDLQAVQSFNALRDDKGGILKVKVQRQHEILFFMGIALIVGVLMTAILGMTMIFKGQHLFVWHMISAGITVTLAMAHAATAIVWFYPF